MRNNALDGPMVWKKTIQLLTIFALCTVGSASVSAFESNETRQDLISREMDCVGRQFSGGASIGWSETCSGRYPQVLEFSHDVASVPRGREPSLTTASNNPSAYAADESPTLFSSNKAGSDSALAARYDDLKYVGGLDESSSRHYPDDSSGWINPSLTTVDVGLDLSKYRYSEPEFMRLKNYMFGVFGAVTFRIKENKHIAKIGDIFSDTNSVNVFNLDAKFSGGDLDYESEGTGTDDDERNYMFETRLTAGYDVPIGLSSRVTPYLGFGFRYLKDDSGGTTTTTGAVGYDRESFYYYIPMGVNTYTELSKCWAFEMTLEYDFFLSGTQKSHLEDTSAGYNTLINHQDNGYGARGSFKLIRRGEAVSLYVEPFARYWDIEDSNLDTITYFEVPVGYGVEPANYTHEYGVRLGMRF